MELSKQKHRLYTEKGFRTMRIVGIHCEQRIAKPALVCRLLFASFSYGQERLLSSQVVPET